MQYFCKNIIKCKEIHSGNPSGQAENTNCITLAEKFLCILITPHRLKYDKIHSVMLCSYHSIKKRACQEYFRILDKLYNYFL